MKGAVLWELDLGGPGSNHGPLAQQYRVKWRVTGAGEAMLSPVQLSAASYSHTVAPSHTAKGQEEPGQCHGLGVGQTWKIQLQILLSHDASSGQSLSCTVTRLTELLGGQNEWRNYE